MGWYPRWKPYVPVARRRANAARIAATLAKKEGRQLTPVQPEGRQIAVSFWGRAWCDNLEGYSDFANRLPRGRTYIRNGSVIDLQITSGKVTALVSGSHVYHVKIEIDTLAAAAWRRILKECSRSVASLIDLLQGRFDEGVMRRLSQRDGGLFPQPREIRMKCSCPDWATMCKHVAATLYGVGTRLDQAPELLFTLRNVDHLELVGQAVEADNLDSALNGGQDSALAGTDLGEMFGIDLESNGRGAPRKTVRSKRSQPEPPSSSERKSRRQPRRSEVAPAVAIATASVRKRATARRGRTKSAAVALAATGPVKRTRARAAAKSPRVEESVQAPRRRKPRSK